MSNGFKHRLSYRLTRNTVLIAMALGLVLNMVQITLDYFTARDAMGRDIQALIEISHNPASQIAYSMDVRLAKELLEGLLQHPAVIDARIVDSDNGTMAAASRSSSVSPYRWISDKLFGANQIFSRALQVSQLDNLPLGTLVVTVDTYHYGLQFLERAGYTLVSGLVKSLVLSASLLAIFYLILTRPMLSVINTLSEVQASSPEKIRLPVPAGHQQDEIGTMVGIINQHLETIDDTLARLRAAESAMKNYSGELEQEVQRRTEETSEKNRALQRSNRALVKAKEDAMRRARSRADFLANMSHEIRTPLNGVLGLVSLALEGEQDSARRQRLEIALSAGESLLGILNDILDISKVEAGKLHLEEIPFNMSRLIEECVALHSQQASRKGISLAASSGTGFPGWFCGDPTRIRQILNNLLSNAIKFTDAGQVQVTASYSNKRMVLAVTDTGIGISEAGIAHIFSPFVQANAHTTRLYGGTGLGLALCRQLIERMQGEIRVDSEEHQGTTFTVSLPLPVHSPPGPDLEQPARGITQPERTITTGTNLITEPPADNPVLAGWPKPAQSSAKASEGSGEPPQGLSILLVEDNNVNQIVAGALLKRMGHRVDMADNGQLALDALNRQPYDLVLMDCQMPVLDGYETTRRIRSNPRWQDLPVIAVTANVVQGDRDTCFACGMNDYITKPYSRHQLSDVIARWAAPRSL